MEQEIIEKLKAQEAKIDTILKSIEKTRKYFQIIVWIMVLTVIVPLVALLFVVPSFLKIYLGTMGGLI